jgi:hypothetical protein
MASYFGIGGSQYVEDSSLDNNSSLDDSGTTVDLILDFDGGSVQSGQGYDIPTDNFDGFNFTAFTPFAESDGSTGVLNEQIFQIVAGVREDFADFNVRVIWDNQGVNSSFFDNNDTVVMVVAESGTSVGVGDIFGIAANVDVPAFTGQPLQSQQDTAFAFLPPHVESSFEPFAYSQIRELIDTISHEAGHTFGLSHTSEQDSEGRQLVTNVGQNQNLDSRFSPEVLDHNPPETGIEYSETDRLNDAVGAASTLPGDTQSSQTLPNEPNTLFLGSIGTTDLISQDGTVNFLGDRDAFRFVAQETGEYTIEQSATDGSLLNPVVTLWDAEGDFVATGTGEVSTITFNATAGTTYFVVAGSDVDRQGSGVVPTGETGAYTLAIGTSSTNPDNPEPFEPNDSITQAYDTGLSGNDSVTLSAVIGDGEFGSSTGDYDYFSLDADAGQTITIETFADSLGTGLDTYVGLYDSFGTLVASDDDSGTGFDSVLNYQVQADGEYYAVVQGFGSGFASDPFTAGTGGGVGSTGEYDVAFTVSGGVNLGPFEPNDSITQAYDTGLSGNDSVTLSAVIGDGEFGDSTGDYDYFSLSADAGQTIAIETFADAVGTGLDTYVGLYDSFGTLVASDDDSGEGFDSVLNYQVQSDGDYYAVVRGFGSGFASDPFTAGTGSGVGSTGEYDVTISVNGPFEPNDSITQAYDTGLAGEGSTTLSAVIGDGDFGDTSGDYDYFSLSADAGDSISIETFADALDTGLDTFVGLYDSFGTLVASDDDSGEGLDSLLNYQVQSDGEYYAVVRGFGSGFASDPLTAGTGGGVGSTGEYDVTISVNGPFEPNDSITQAYDTGLAGEGSTTLSAVIGDGDFGNTSGDYDYFSLSADAGDSIGIETFADSLGTGLDTFVGLYDSFGTLLASDDDSGTGLNSVLNYQVQADGEYYAVVWGYGSGFASDPFTAGTGGGVGSIGEYDVTISVNSEALVFA